MTTAPFDFVRSPQGDVTDIVMEKGLSLHFFKEGVGIYSARIESGKGYAQLTKRDMRVLVEFFTAPENLALLSAPGTGPGRAPAKGDPATDLAASGSVD